MDCHVDNALWVLGIFYFFSYMNTVYSDPYLSVHVIKIIANFNINYLYM